MDSQQPPTRGATRSFDSPGALPPGFNAGGPPDPVSRPDPARRAEGDAKQFAEDAKQQARAATEQVKQGASDAARQVKEQVKSGAQAVTEQAGQQAAEAARMIREHGTTMLGDQKQRAAGGLETVGSAIRGAAERLHEAKDDNIAHYMDAAAESVERASNYLKQRDVGQLFDDAQSLARRRPEWFFGGAFIVGLALGRFAKAHRPQPEPSDYRTGFDADDRSTSGGQGAWGDPTPTLLPSPEQALARPGQMDAADPTPSGYGSGMGLGTGVGISAGTGSGPFLVPNADPNRLDGPDILTNPPANLLPRAGDKGVNP